VRRFQAVVVGSPVHSGQWERDAVESLLQRPAFRMRGGRSGDSRDWPAIGSWTHEIARQMPAIRACGRRYTIQVTATQAT
jgi:hypothetical protein